MILLIIMGYVSILCIGTVIASWAGVDIHTYGSDIKNIIMLIFGIGILVFGVSCLIKASNYYQEKESPKTEITTSIPPQIDTIITIKNSVSDTTYIYKFNPEK